jgi:hypothetical protein
MASILLVGIDPALVDFLDPGVPQGLNADIIRKGIATALDEIRAAGHVALQEYIPPDPSGLSALADRLARERIDCIVIGGGVRLPPRNLELFEALINLISRAPAPPAIALVNRPEEAAAAVARVLGGGGGWGGGRGVRWVLAPHGRTVRPTLLLHQTRRLGSA